MNGGVIDLNTNIFTCRDTSGNLVEIDIYNLMPFTVFGMDMATIAELRHQYLLHNGHEPITAESVKLVFSK